MEQSDRIWKDEARCGADEGRGAEEGLEAAIQRALEACPAVEVPESFAARVRASLPARTRPRRRRSRGQMAGILSAAVLVMAMCWLAQRAQPSFANLAFDLELAMMAELSGVAAWLGMRHSGR